MGSLEIRPVHSTGDLRFIHPAATPALPDEPNWVAPLLFERRQFLDRRKNLFFRHGRGGVLPRPARRAPVGRITAQVDDNFQRFQENRWGWFGFFWSARRIPRRPARCWTAPSSGCAAGCDRMVGPADFTTNDECGILLEGHERTPLILSPWTHRYYPALMEAPWPRRWTS